MKILLIGSTGQIGWELRRSLMPLGTVIAVSQSTQPLQIDLVKPDQIRSIMAEINPDLVINAAAYTAVDRAESEPELARWINGVAPGILAEEAKRMGAGLIHYSTDYVFDGRKGSPYGESDLTAPLNVYGKTKLEGEKAIVSVDGNYLILRTSWVYGNRGKNFLRTVLRLAQEKPELRIVNDQWGAPTWSRTIADCTTFILTQSGASLPLFFEKFKGIYHLTASGITNWYEFARSILELAPETQSYLLQNLISIPTTEYPTPAQRPAYSVLDTSLVQKTFGLTLPDWQEALKLVLTPNES
jgi:dTDP-4-dehydrorhamnose reductase